MNIYPKHLYISYEYILLISIQNMGGENMPSFDGTGPCGQGPMTGRGMGPCGRGMGRGYGRGYGRGFGRGLGRGFGRGFGPAAPVQPVWEPVPITKDQEKQMLQDEMKYLEQGISEIKKRLQDLK
jgi:hypothetical protein